MKSFKVTLIVLLVVWLLLFSIDSIVGIPWGNYILHRVFIWTPTVIIAVYWLAFGGAKKKKGSPE